MAILTGRVRGREIRKNRDGTTDKILLQVELTSPDDIQTVEWVNHDGEDSSPPDGSMVIVVAISNSYKIAIACDDGILAESQPGEKILYSQLNGLKKATFSLRTDSTMELNGNVDFAVRFTALQVAFNTLLSAFNAHIEAFNIHNHGGVTIGEDFSLSPLPPEIPTEIDLTPAKVESVKLP